MKILKLSSVAVGLCSLAMLGSAYGMPLNSAARSVVPAETQQLISVDYRAMKDSPTAMQLKQQIMGMQDNLKQFEIALKGIGIDPDKDVDSLTFAAFRTPKGGNKSVGVAAGPFNMKAVLKKLKLTKPTKYRQSNIYPMDGGMMMCFLDDSTLAFGESSALRMALDARDGEILNLDTNQTMSDMMSSVDAAPVWSILDQEGTQNMMRSALGDAAKIADYETVKKRLLGSRYTMSFSSGVNFDLTVVTSDSVTAGTLSSLVKAGLLFKKMSATPAEKVAMENTTVDSDSQNLQMHFKANDQQFQSLMHSDLFAAVSR